MFSDWSWFKAENKSTLLVSKLQLINIDYNHQIGENLK